MRDEIDGRLWAEHGQSFSREVAAAFAAAAANLAAGFRRLNQIQFDAPWKRDARGPGQA
jgi:hypothetical protein